MTVTQHTVLPEHQSSDYDVIVRLLEEEHLFLEGDAGSVNLPPSVLASLREIVGMLQSGMAVSFGTVSPVMTTQEAAEFLSISRPTLVKLLEGGEIEYTQPGRHRRVALQSILNYLERSSKNRREALDLMLVDSAEIPDEIATKPYIPKR